MQFSCPGRNSRDRISFCSAHLQPRAILISSSSSSESSPLSSVPLDSDLSTPPVYSFSHAWALFYLQDFEFFIDFKAPAELLGSLVVDLVVADVQVNQHVIDFESFSQGQCSLIANAIPRKVEYFQCLIALGERRGILATA